VQQRIGAEASTVSTLSVNGVPAPPSHEVLGPHAHRDRLGRPRAQLRGKRTRTPSPTSTSSPARLPGRKFIAGEPMKPPRRARRVVVDVDRAADLLDHAEVHHDHAVGERHRLDLVVGDEDAGGLQLPVQLLDLEAHLHAQLGVEVGERLVEQERGGLAHDRAAHGDALALAAGERARLPVEEGPSSRIFAARCTRSLISSAACAGCAARTTCSRTRVMCG
jgi:hypothetical protein